MGTDLAKDNLKQAASAASTSTGVLVTLALSFMLLLVHNVSTAPKEAAAERRLEALKAKLSQVKSEIAKAGTPRFIVGYSQLQLDDLKKKQNILEEEIKEKKDELSGDLELPFSIKLKRTIVSARLVPLIVAVLGLWLVAYLAVKKCSILALIARSLRELKDHGYGDQQMAELVTGPPWWLAPLPGVSGQGGVTPHDLLVVFGWQNKYSSLRVLAYVQLGIFASLEALSLFSAIRLQQDYASSTSAKIVLSCATGLVGWLSVMAILRVAFPGAIDDQDPPAPSISGLSRRDWIAGMCSVPIPFVADWFGGLTAGGGRKIASGGHRSPRFRRPKAPGPSLPRPGGGMDSVVDSKGRLRFVSSLNPPGRQPNLHRAHGSLSMPLRWTKLADALRAVPSTGAPNSDKFCKALLCSHVSWTFEHAAEEAFGRNEIDAAVGLLQRGIKEVPHDVRLMDRLAALAVQKQRTADLTWLKDHVNGLLQELRSSRRLANDAAPPPKAGEERPARRLRHVCVEGKKVLRISAKDRRGAGEEGVWPRRNQASLLAGRLEGRLASWNNENSRWYKRREGGTWKLPSPARKCKSDTL